MLGQTVRIKNLEKKAELNGRLDIRQTVISANTSRCELRCGVCIGYEKEQDRYIVRLIMGGVETEFALKHRA